MKCLDKKRIKMKQGETLALNERIMLSLVSTGVSGQPAPRAASGPGPGQPPLTPSPRPQDCPFIVCMSYAFHTPDKLSFILDLMNGEGRAGPGARGTSGRGWGAGAGAERPPCRAASLRRGPALPPVPARGLLRGRHALLRGRDHPGPGAHAQPLRRLPGPEGELPGPLPAQTAGGPGVPRTAWPLPSPGPRV